MKLNFIMMMMFVLSNMFCLEFILNIFLFWFFLELNSFMFIFLSFKKMDNYFQNFYFIISITSSFMILLNILTKNIFYMKMMILIKMGLFPFYGWILKLFFMMNMNFFFLLMTIQKIPLIMMMMITKMNMSNMFMEFILVMNILLCLILMFYSNNFNFIILIYSFFSNSLILILCFMKMNLLIVYFVFFMMDFLLIKNENLNKNMLLMKFYKISLMIILISMISMPPFPNFILKLNFINLFYENMNKYLILLTIMMNIFNMIMLLKFLMFIKFNKKMTKFNNMILIYMIFLFLMLL